MTHRCHVRKLAKQRGLARQQRVRKLARRPLGVGEVAEGEKSHLARVPGER